MHSVAPVLVRRRSVVRPANAPRPAIAAAVVSALLLLTSVMSATCNDARAADAIAWGTTVAWLDFDTALARARAEQRAIGVVLYADWCPKCRSLAPQFVSGPVADASGKILWVLQNHDAQPAWLTERFGDLGNYVPRIFFLRPDGSLDPEINSGHPRYPYFYLANKPEVLVASIERAATPPAISAPSPSPPAIPAPLPSPPPAEVRAGRTWTDDLPLVGGLVAVAFAAIWAMGRGKDSTPPAP
jgi:hypothetical protein